MRALADPPKAMPGWVVVLPLPMAGPAEEEKKDPYTIGVVVEMSWAEEQGSDNYIFGPRFGTGARVLYTSGGYSSPLTLDGFTFVQLHSIVGWEDAA